MATRNHTRSARVPRKRLVVLVVLIAALIAALAAGSITTKKSRWSPELALDLQGGTEIILTPTATDNSEVTASDLQQAIEIIRQRVDASGVAEAEISAQGGQNIIVGLPGTPSEDTLNLVRTSAVMQMRPVLQITGLSTSLTPAVVSKVEAKASASASATPSGAGTTASPSASASATPSVDPSARYTEDELKQIATKYADTNGDGQISDEPTKAPENASDTAWITERVMYDSYILDCTDASTTLKVGKDPKKAVVACGEGGSKYILGPSEIEGTRLTKATSGWDPQGGRWVVSIEFDSEGGDTFAKVTGRLIGLKTPRNQFAIVLDGKVISAAAPETTISGGRAQISGAGITQTTSATLANQLSFGSLPLEFKVQSEQQISATLGSESLHAGLLAGGIGVLLLVLYLLWAYQGLGIVAIASIALATGVSYLLVSLLSWTMGYRLSMAGVVGFIVSIGITADSFIVFFERIRDEIREGRSLSAAVQYGWHRAKRTIYVADGCNLLCALVLYFLAVGSVRGFAFTLGLTTILDLVVVIMFTYPVMAMLVRCKFFGEGHRWSGMSAEALGRTPAYRGRGEFRSKEKKQMSESEADASIDSAEGSGVVDAEGMTLAERKAAQRRRAKEEAAAQAEATAEGEE